MASYVLGKDVGTQRVGRVVAPEVAIGLGQVEDLPGNAQDKAEHIQAAARFDWTQYVLQEWRLDLLDRHHSQPRCQIRLD